MFVYQSNYMLCVLLAVLCLSTVHPHPVIADNDPTADTDKSEASFSMNQAPENNQKNPHTSTSSSSIQEADDVGNDKNQPQDTVKNKRSDFGLPDISIPDISLSDLFAKLGFDPAEILKDLKGKSKKAMKEKLEILEEKYKALQDVDQKKEAQKYMDSLKDMISEPLTDLDLEPNMADLESIGEMVETVGKEKMDKFLKEMKDKMENMTDEREIKELEKYVRPLETMLSGPGHDMVVEIAKQCKDQKDAKAKAKCSLDWLQDKNKKELELKGKEALKQMMQTHLPFVEGEMSNKLKGLIADLDKDIQATKKKQKNTAASAVCSGWLLLAMSLTLICQNR